MPIGAKHIDPERETGPGTQSLGNSPGAGALDDDNRISVSFARRRAALTLQAVSRSILPLTPALAQHPWQAPLPSFTRGKGTSS
jgi:hypothetical protein